MESAKEKAIREAWAEHYDFVKVNLESDGSFWVYEYQTELYDWCKKNTKCIQQTLSGTSRFIPWKIIGIETNNGWTRIESEADLPTENEKYFVIRNGVIDTGVYSREYNKWICIGMYYFTPTGDLKITHWQPILKPNLPIY